MNNRQMSSKTPKLPGEKRELVPPKVCSVYHVDVGQCPEDSILIALYIKFLRRTDNDSKLNSSGRYLSGQQEEHVADVIQLVSYNKSGAILLLPPFGEADKPDASSKTRKASIFCNTSSNYGHYVGCLYASTAKQSGFPFVNKPHQFSQCKRQS